MKPMHRHRGFAAVAALFLVVVLAALGSYMVNFSNTQQLTSAQDVQGSRAYWAARAGLEWAVAGHVAAAACVAPSTDLTVLGFTVRVTCTLRTYADASVTGAADTRVFNFTSTASTGAAVGNVGFIERSVSASMEY